jgi:hypothetical protein
MLAAATSVALTPIAAGRDFRPGGNPDRSGAVLDCSCALLLGAMGTTVDFATLFYPVSDNPAIAVSTSGRHPLDCAFKTVERHRAAVPTDTERFVIVITANVTFRH